MRKRFTRFAILGVALALAVPAGAQELRGRLVGTVSDATGAVLPGVTVTASSPALIQDQVVVSGGQGTYVFPALPTGVYTVSFALPGFGSVVRENIQMTLNTTLTVNTTLNVGTLEEVITITGQAPVVDVKTTTTGVNFTEELLEDIPNARDIWAAMAQAPGFQMEGYDVGGSHMGTQTGFQAFGFGDQHRTMLEGINVTETTSGNAGYFDYGSFEDFQLGGSGNMGETHGLGAFFNLTVKSGGDRFNGDIYVDFENDSTVGDNVPDALRTGGGTSGPYKAGSRGLEAGNPITLQSDINIGIGGPLYPGKAWFYGGYRLNHQEKLTIGNPDPATTQLGNWTAKATYQLSDSSQLIGFFNRRTKLQAERNLGPTIPVDAAWYQSSVNKPMKLGYTERPHRQGLPEPAAQPLDQPVPAVLDPDEDGERGRAAPRPGGGQHGRHHQRPGLLPLAQRHQAADLRQPDLLCGRLRRAAHAQDRDRDLPGTPEIPADAAGGHLLSGS